MKILLMSDSHYNKEAVDLARRKYPDIQCRVHCGDILMPPEKMEDFHAVSGNMDFRFDYPFELSLEIENFRILIKHGHDLFFGAFPDYHALAMYAKEGGYNAVFFGHSHMYFDEEVMGVRLLNPGSVWRTRDNSPCTYMIVTIENGTMRAERHEAVDLLDI